MTDQEYMQKALNEAKQAFEEGEVPVGAVIVCRDRIIARAHNLTERLTDDCTLYVTVEPCVMCAGALAWAQLSRIVYGASDPKRGFSVFAPNALHPRTEVTEGILAEECANLMKDFFQRKR